MTNELGETIDEIMFRAKQKREAIEALDRIYREPYHAKSFNDYSKIYNFLLEAQ